MKKLIAVLLSVCMIMGVLAGCGSSDKNKDGEKISVVTTIFPEYDWVRNIIGDDSDNTELTLLLKNGTDLHSFQPTTDDMIKISDADVFIYVGGPSDVWVDDVLENAKNKDMIAVNLFDLLGDTLKPVPVVQGMEHHHEHEGEIHEHDKDEHIWLSLGRTIKAVDYIADALGEADPDNSKKYRKNADAYIKELTELDGQYKEAVESGTGDTLIFADRFPFFYMADDYGINYFAAFTGCSAESEASFETVAFLAGKVDELGIKNILTIENRTHKVPETVIDNTASKDQKILVLNSLQSVTTEDIDEGLTYIDVMKSNLEIIKEALQ